MVNTGIYVWNGKTLDLGDSKSIIQSLKSHTTVNAVGPNPTVSSVTMSSDVHPVVWDTSVPAIVVEKSRTASYPTESSGNGHSENINVEEPLQVLRKLSVFSVWDDTAEKSVSLRQFSRKCYETIATVTNLDQAMEVSPIFREMRKEHEQMFNAYIQSYELYYSKGVLTGTLLTIVHRNEIAIKRLLGDECFNKRLKPAVQVALVN